MSNTPETLQRKESQYDIRHQHCVSVQRFETYYMKNSISYRGSNVWNLLEPSAVSAWGYAKRAKKSHALRNLNFNEELFEMIVPASITAESLKRVSQSLL